MYVALSNLKDVLIKGRVIPTFGEIVRLRPHQHASVMPRTVLEKLRRASEQLPGRRKSSVAGSSMSEHRDSSINNQQASFLGLPAEIRNQIYERLALATTLSLTPPKSRKQGVLPVGLLLCCRQIHKEYRPLLLSLATIQIYVNDYNFGNVIRVLEKLQERDLALLLDNRLYIVLRLAHVPSRDDRQSLRAWHNYRSSGSGPYFKKGTMEAHKLAFKYDLYFHPQMRPPRPASRYAGEYPPLWTNYSIASRLSRSPC